MIAACLAAVGDLGDRGVLAVLVRSLAVTLLVFAGLGALLAVLLAGTDPCGWAGLDACPLGPGAGTLGALALTFGALWLLFPAVALGVVTAYGDGVVAAVERRHYPAALAGARPLGAGGALALGLRSSMRVILYNLAALPLYLVLLVTGIGPLLLFLIVNGAAFGRDLGELVAARHGDRPARRRWLARTRTPRAAIGAAAAALFLVPVLNLLAPVLAAAAVTHLFHSPRRLLS